MNKDKISFKLRKCMNILENYIDNYIQINIDDNSRKLRGLKEKTNILRQRDRLFNEKFGDNVGPVWKRIVNNIDKIINDDATLKRTFYLFDYFTSCMNDEFGERIFKLLESEFPLYPFKETTKN
jgi:hypothetical protein